jgi:hypothetical protein
MEKKFTKKIHEMIWAMANIRPEETGLPMVIWIKPKGNEKHGPRIKVQKEHGEKANEGQWVTVTIEDNPKIIGDKLSTEDMKLVKKFINLNRDTLLQIWNDTISLSKAINKFIKV